MYFGPFVNFAIPPVTTKKIAALLYYQSSIHCYCDDGSTPGSALRLLTLGPLGLLGSGVGGA